MGVSQAGFRHAAVIEWNRDACSTLRANQRRGIRPVAEWPDVYEGDARTFDFNSLGAVDLVAGGPPCQPFSLGGKHGAHADSRDMWPEAIRAVRELRPRACWVGAVTRNPEHAKISDDPIPMWSKSRWAFVVWTPR